MPNFVAQQTTQSHVIHVPTAIDRAFSLFEPLGEKNWAHGWDPDMVYPISGIAQEGTVFTTQHPDEPTKVWMIAAHERGEQSRVTYFNVLPEAYTTRIDVQCEPSGVEATTARITYTLTALSPQGNEYISKFTQEDHYREFISSWETAIQNYLFHEDVLPHTH